MLISNDYVEELESDYAFDTLIPELFNLFPKWDDTTQLGGQYYLLPRKMIIDIDYFNQLDKLLTHDIVINNVVVRKVYKGRWQPIHTDGDNTPLSINIPLTNKTKDAITSWYNFDSDDYLRGLITAHHLIPNDSPLKLSTESAINHIKKFKVFEYRMSGPVLFNTSIPHNVHNLGEEDRLIASIQFSRHGRMVQWEHRSIVKEAFNKLNKKGTTGVPL
jgi:hypothetical protein